jgi:hypothetical protein
MLVFGCAKDPIVVREPIEVPITVYETVPVPTILLRPCSVDTSELWTNQDLEQALAAALIELQSCTDDKEAIGRLE